MIEEMKQQGAVINLVEVVYRKKATTLLNKMWGSILEGSDITINQQELTNLVDELVQKYYTALTLTFDTTEEVVDYCEHQLKYQEQEDMMAALTEKSTQDLMTEETMQKVFNL